MVSAQGFCQKWNKPACYWLISVLLAADVKQVLKGTRQVKMREFSRFYDKQETAVPRLPLAVNVMLNLSDMFNETAPSTLHTVAEF